MKSGTDRAQPPPTCFECDAPVRTEWRDHTFTYGTDESAIELTVSVPIETCGECGHGSLGHEAERLMHEAVCMHYRVLTPQEVRAIRERHGLSRAAFAEASGLGEATLHRWENGILIQSRANDRYLRLLTSADNLRTLQQIGARSEAASPAWCPSFRVLTEVSVLRMHQAAYELRIASA